MKKKEETIKKLLDASSNTFVDKLASLKYVSKRDSKLLSSVVSGILKKKEVTIFLVLRKHNPDASHYFDL